MTRSLVVLTAVVLSSAPAVARGAGTVHGFSPGRWTGTMKIEGGIDNGSIHASGQGRGKFSFTTTATGRVKTGHISVGETIVTTGPEGTFNSYSYGGMPLSGDSTLVTGLGPMEFHIETPYGAVDGPVDSEVSLRPLAATCTTARGDAAIAAREFQTSAGFATNVTALFTAHRTSGATSDRRNIARELRATRTDVDLYLAHPANQTAAGLAAEAVKDLSRAVFEPRVAIDRTGDALAVWSNVNQSVRGAYRPAGQSFGPAFDIGTGIDPQASMDAAGDATVIWAGIDATLHGRMGHGTSFGQPFDLSTQQVGEYALAANAAGDTIAAMDETNGSVLHAVFTPPGGALPSPQDLEDNGIFAGSSQDGGPAAVVDPAGDSTVVWYHSNPGGYRSIRAAFRPAGGSFGSPFDLSLPGVDATGAQVATDQGGTAIYVWERNDSKTGFETVQALLPAPPPPSPPPPGTGGVGPIGGIPGPPGGGSPGPAPGVPPRLKLLRLTPAMFSIKGRIVRGRCMAITPRNRGLRQCTRPVSLRVSFDATSAGTVTLTVQQAALGRLARVHCVAPSARNRRARRCTRLTTLRGRFTEHVHAGTNTLVYTRRGLGPGSYRLLATPSLPGKTGRALSTTFRVVG